MFADEIDNPCPDCKLRGRIKLCPFYMNKCRHYDDNKNENSNTKTKSVDKEIDRELED